MRVLVVYDISDNEARARLAEDLKRLGLARVQRSAFIGSVSSASINEIRRVCATRARGPSDVVHIVPLCDHDWRRVVVIGRPVGERLGDVVVV